MYRDNYEKHVPTCPKTVPVVDQYLWKERDTNKYTCTNGVSHPIYDCKGDVSFTLPLEMYPPAGKVHPQIALSNRMHYNYRMSPDFVELAREGYDADTSAIQYDLLDQGSFDMDAPPFFRQKEGFTQESNQRPYIPKSAPGLHEETPLEECTRLCTTIAKQAPSLGREGFTQESNQRPYIPDSAPGLYKGNHQEECELLCRTLIDQKDGGFGKEGYGGDRGEVCTYGLCNNIGTGREGYGSASSIQFDLLDQGSFNMNVPGYFGHSTSIPRPRRRPPVTNLQKFLQPWNPDIFSNESQSERFAQIPTPSANFPLEYQSPLMQPPHTLRTPYGIRPGSECKGLYGV
jgi:hypothetical protein